MNKELIDIQIDAAFGIPNECWLTYKDSRLLTATASSPGRVAAVGKVEIVFRSGTNKSWAESRALSDMNWQEYCRGEYGQKAT